MTLTHRWRGRRIPSRQSNSVTESGSGPAGLPHTACPRIRRLSPPDASPWCRFGAPDNGTEAAHDFGCLAAAPDHEFPLRRHRRPESVRLPSSPATYQNFPMSEGLDPRDMDGDTRTRERLCSGLGAVGRLDGERLSRRPRNAPERHRAVQRVHQLRPMAGQGCRGPLESLAGVPGAPCHHPRDARALRAAPLGARLDEALTAPRDRASGAERRVGCEWQQRPHGHGTVRVLGMTAAVGRSPRRRNARSSRRSPPTRPLGEHRLRPRLPVWPQASCWLVVTAAVTRWAGAVSRARVRLSQPSGTYPAGCRSVLFTRRSDQSASRHLRQG